MPRTTRSPAQAMQFKRFRFKGWIVGMQTQIERFKVDDCLSNYERHQLLEITEALEKLQATVDNTSKVLIW